MAKRSTPQEHAVSERTRRRHRELADAVRDLLKQRFTEPLTLGEISAPLGVSPGFLCRVFRRETGATIHGFLVNLRLARAVELLGGGQGKNLTRLGLDLGFASHSHFTRAFCRRFGRHRRSSADGSSRNRALPGRRRQPILSKILQAPLRAQDRT